MFYNSWAVIISQLTNFEIKKGITSFVNPYSMLLLKDRSDIANQIDYWHIDGSLLIKIISLFIGKHKIGRFSFDDTSLAPLVFQFSKEHNLKIALIGTKEEYIHTAVSNIEKKHGIKISYYRNGYFTSDSEKFLCFDNILTNKIDIVICGMGTPFQEEFLIDLQNQKWEGYGFTCGGYLHQISRKENYYPKLFDILDLRWLYRIIDEPKLFKRYFFIYPLFIAKFIRYAKHSK